jgi:acyl transferase domain-containing protein
MEKHKVSRGLMKATRSLSADYISESLIRSVYKNGGMDPRDTGYVEAHGTGTRVGDPIEVGAIHRVFGEGRTKRKPLYIGSVKSNIGHLEAAAGKSELCPASRDFQ